MKRQQLENLIVTGKNYKTEKKHENQHRNIFMSRLTGTGKDETIDLIRNTRDHTECIIIISAYSDNSW